jgi:hypothetical protein
MMRGIRQAASIFHSRSLYPTRRFAGEIASRETVVKESGEVGIASGAPETIYARKVGVQLPARWDHRIIDDTGMADLLSILLSGLYDRKSQGGHGVSFHVQVLIYAPARTAGQQGKSQTIDAAGKGPGWKLIFETQQK